MSSPGRLEFEVGFGPAKKPLARDPGPDDGDQLRVLVLADFSGRAQRSTHEPVATRKPVRVDHDNFDAVFANSGSQLSILDANVAFASLEDFHPDALIRQSASLTALLAARRALDTAAAASAAEMLRQVLRPGAPAAAPAETKIARTAHEETDDDVLARLLGKSPDAPPAPASEGFSVESVVRNIAATSSSAIPAAPAGAAGLAAAAEMEIAARLRALLHDHHFQTLEAAWRGLDFLVRRCPDEERVRYYVLDVSPAELDADSAGLERVLRAQRCDLVLCHRTFGGTADDLRAVGRLAQACHPANVLLLAGAVPRLAGCDAFAIHPDPDDWLTPPAPDVAESIAALRASPEGARVLLALPRFLLRQPYGRAADPIDSFPFEELPNDPDHELFLWGNPAFLVAQTMIETFAAGQPVGHLDGSTVVGDLPVARYIDHDGTAVKPCAEAWLTDRAVQRLADCGLTPVQSERNADRVRVWHVRVGGA